MLDQRVYSQHFTRPSFGSFENYVFSLSTEMRSFSVLGSSVLHDFSYDRQDYFIRVSRWNEMALNRTRLEKDITANGKKHFNLVIDDSAQRRFTSTQFYSAKNYIGNLGKIDTCTSCVYSLFTDGSNPIPVDFEVYLPRAYQGTRILFTEYRSKIDLAISLILRGYYVAKELGVDIAHVLFDTWYAATRLLNTLNIGGVHYLTEIRPNRCVKLDKRKLRAQDLVTVLNSEPVTVYHKGKQYQLTAVFGSLHEADHMVKIFIVNGNFSGKKQRRYIVTNDLTMNKEEAIMLLCMRWDIDYFFREAKTYLCLADSKFQKLRCFKRHIYLCFVAWSYVRWIIRSADKKKIRTVFAAVRWIRKCAA